jgi:hypothetical protein
MMMFRGWVVVGHCIGRIEQDGDMMYIALGDAKLSKLTLHRIRSASEKGSVD